MIKICLIKKIEIQGNHTKVFENENGTYFVLKKRIQADGQKRIPFQLIFGDFCRSNTLKK